MDFLGLTTLTVIDDCLKLIEQTRGEKLDIETIPLDDEETYKKVFHAAQLQALQLGGAFGPDAAQGGDGFLQSVGRCRHGGFIGEARGKWERQMKYRNQLNGDGDGGLRKKAGRLRRYWVE